MTELLISNGKRHLLPDSWNELSYTQLYDNALSIFEYNIAKDEVKRAYLKARIAFNLSGFSPAAQDNGFLMNEIQSKVLPALDWMFESNLLTKQNLPSVLLRKRFALCRFYGPADDFSNLSFEEFDDAEYWFHELMNPDLQERERALNMLCAILYRPFAQKKGDTRIDYSPHDNEARAKWFSFANTRMQLCVLLWYMGCRTHLTNDFRELFAGHGDGEGNLTLLAHGLSGPVLGDIDKLNKRPVRQVLTEALRLYRQAESREQNQQSAT